MFYRKQYEHISESKLERNLKGASACVRVCLRAGISVDCHSVFPQSAVQQNIRLNISYDASLLPIIYLFACFIYSYVYLFASQYSIIVYITIILTYFVYSVSTSQ